MENGKNVHIHWHKRPHNSSKRREKNNDRRKTFSTTYYSHHHLHCRTPSSGTISLTSTHTPSGVQTDPSETSRSHNGTSWNVKIITDATHRQRQKKNSNWMHARVVTRWLLHTLLRMYITAIPTPARKPTRRRTFLFAKYFSPKEKHYSLSTHVAHTHTRSTRTCTERCIRMSHFR